MLGELGEALLWSTLAKFSLGLSPFLLLIPKPISQAQPRPQLLLLLIPGPRAEKMADPGKNTLTQREGGVALATPHLLRCKPGEGSSVENTVHDSLNLHGILGRSCTPGLPGVLGRAAGAPTLWPPPVKF